MPLILALFCLAGCIQESTLPEENMQGRVAEASLFTMEMNFDPEVNSRLFSVKGYLKISGNRPLPYLLLNASLLKSGRLLCSTRYLMIEIDPERDCSFEISKNLRIWPGSYSCILEALGPEGQMASEFRECRVIGPFLVEPAPDLKRAPAPEELSLAEEQGDIFAKPTKARAAIQEKSAKNMDESDAISINARPSEALKSEPGVMKEGLVGSTTSNKYHRQNCRYADKIRADNKVYFESEDAAKKQGYSPCKACAP